MLTLCAMKSTYVGEIRLGRMNSLRNEIVPAARFWNTALQTAKRHECEAPASACLTAVRSRSGSESHLGSHSRPSRRFATLRGNEKLRVARLPLRGKGDRAAVDE